MRAATHLIEMQDLADRILAMGNTLATYETGKPPVTLWNLGRELAELVVHFNLDDALNHLSTARTALDDPAGLEEAVQRHYALVLTESGEIAHFDHNALKGAAIEEIDQAIHDLYEEKQ